MVQELRRVIERQDSYRLYSSSLLIIYDGAVTPSDLTSNSEPIRRRDPGLIGANEACRERATGTIEANNVDNQLRPVGGGESVQCKDIDGYCSSERNGRLERESELELSPPNFVAAEKKCENHVSYESATLSNGTTLESSNLLHVNSTGHLSLHHHLGDGNIIHVKHAHRYNGALSETTPISSTPPENSATATAEQDRYTYHCHTDCKPRPPHLQEHETRPLPLNRKKVKNRFHHGNEESSRGRHFELHYITKEELGRARKCVDLRMIDFAHATHRGYDDQVQYSGPDEGYVLGVTSLVNCFERMLSETSAR